MSKSKESEKILSASIEDRTQELLDKEFGNAPDKSIPKEHLDLYDVPAAPSGVSNYSQERNDKTVNPRVTDSTGESLIPSVMQIFDGAEHLVHTMQKELGLSANVDPGAEPKEVKIKRTAEPDSLYLDKADPRLQSLLIYFVAEYFGKEESVGVMKQLWKAKNNMNTGIVSLIRQRFWDCMKKRSFKKLPEEYIKNGLLQDTGIDNRRLQMLLGENVYDELNDFAVALETSNKTAFGACLKYALDPRVDLIEQEPNRPWTI